MALHQLKIHSNLIFKPSLAANVKRKGVVCNSESLHLLPTLTARTLARNSQHSVDKSLVRKFFQVLLFGEKICSESGSLRSLAGNLVNRFNENLNVLSQQFARQCYGILSQRIRRSLQTIKLYRDLGYDKRYAFEILKRISKSFGQQRRYIGFLAAVAFNWKEEQITEDEVHEVESEIGHVHRLEENKTAQLEKHFEKEWEKVIDRPKLLAWRKPVPGSCFYQYKLYGTVDHLPARAFYNAQIDIDYRRQWDKLVIKLDIIDRDRQSNSEVVHWVSHFPYPMYPREYVYIRKFKVDQKNNLLYTMARSCSHPSVPVGDKFVRVETYISHMVIRPYTTFDENGFDYILTYYDEPKSNFPTFAYNWIASSGVPDFVEQMYSAARYLHKHGKTYHETDGQENHDQVPL